mmetsp:Transcript_71950/g.158882  ORF Transcript_71950/g.158882 Transcript_71950/m.158882 type:complete len:240 (+) Transcript_71950:396-1115(+)
MVSSKFRRPSPFLSKAARIRLIFSSLDSSSASSVAGPGSGAAAARGGAEGWTSGISWSTSMGSAGSTGSAGSSCAFAWSMGSSTKHSSSPAEVSSTDAGASATKKLSSLSAPLSDDSSDSRPLGKGGGNSSNGVTRDTSPVFWVTSVATTDSSSISISSSSASKSNISQEHTEGLRGDVSAAFSTGGKADGERLPALWISRRKSCLSLTRSMASLRVAAVKVHQSPSSSWYLARKSCTS